MNKDIIRIAHERGNFSTIYSQTKDTVAIKQVSTAMTYPGVIKAFHCHKQQTDIWYVLQGNIKVVIYNEKTKSFNVFFIGEDSNNQTITIQPGLWHGYQVLGNEPAFMLYLLSSEYNPKDEFREDYNKFYNWEVVNK